MNEAVYQTLMPLISAQLLMYTADKKQIAEEEAMTLLYRSKLYALLEDEETKLWHYSTPMLYGLLEEEWEDGTLTFPDV